MVTSDNGHGKTRSSPLALLFPWLAPFVIKFAVVNGGITVQLHRNNRLLQNWRASKLEHVLPKTLTQWIDDYHILIDPQPYPLIKQLWQQLMPLASKKLIIDSSVLAGLEEVSQPQDFALVWTINRSLVCIEGRYEGADHYLGMGWFQKGTKIWSMNNSPPTAIDSQLKNLTVRIQQANFLLNSIVPNLQHYLPTRADFQLITNFALQVRVIDVRDRELILALQCNYPQLLPITQVSQQQFDTLLADHAIIQFPRQALTPAVIQLLKNSSSITIQGVGIPLFIREQLPTLLHYRQISDDMAAKITQSHPIISLATLRPTLSFSHIYEHGLGKYVMATTYQYQQHTLDIPYLLVAHQQKQRFVQQQGVWFEWPYDSNDLVHTLQQPPTQVLRPEESMGFNTQRVAFLQTQPIVQAIRPEGTTPVEHGQSVFRQLRYHGIPGGIIGEPPKITAMLIDACEHLLRDNPQAQILWLAPSRKKSAVTRAVNGSLFRSSISVTSPAILLSQQALISHPWTLVIFQALDQLLLESVPSTMLSRLKRKWAITSVTSKHALSPSIMQVLHLPEEHYAQFCARYLFDLSISYNNETTGQHLSGRNAAQSKSSTPLPTRRTIKLNQKTIVRLHQESEQLQDRLTVEEEQEQLQITPRPISASAPPTDSTGPSKLQKPLQVGGKDHMAEVTTQIDIPVKEVERIRQQSSSISPPEQRVAVLKRYWYLFDEIHARQKTGMKPLWGLIEDSRTFDFEQRFRSHEPYQFQLYRQLLPPTILAEIDQLWGTTMLPRYPERIVSEPFPHWLFAATFGQALKFWHGCALTAWFFCEGPSSRTNLAGMAKYYHKDIQALKEIGTPINEQLFAELVRAEAQLGRPQPLTRQVATTQGNIGITLTSTTSYGTRRNGFEKLRDIISSYRRQWAERYLDQYLQKQWETEIRDAVHSYKLFCKEKGTPFRYRFFG